MEKHSQPPPTPRISPYGDAALLVELEGLEDVHRAYASLKGKSVTGVVDLVPAAQTLLVKIIPGEVDMAGLERALIAPAGSAKEPAAGPLVEVPVVYDGQDLHEVAALADVSVDEVISLHSEGEYRAAFCGFVPGFAYLTGLDARLDVPRLNSPRVRVPAGSVAIADQFSAVYPRESPGGWRLIGHTDLELFNVERDPPALLAPTTRVRFRPV